MADQAADYHRGDMDIREQVSSFHLFMALTKWGSLYLAAGLILLTLWFCTTAGFLGGLVTALVILVLGVMLLREKKH
jgi:thiamine transporter ThiT